MCVQCSILCVLVPLQQPAFNYTKKPVSLVRSAPSLLPLS